MTEMELISKPLRKVRAVFPGIFWFLKGMKAKMSFPELQLESEPVST